MKLLLNTILVFLFLSATPATAQQNHNFSEAYRLTKKLWKVIEIRKSDTSPYQVHMVLEAPDQERKELTLTDGSVRTLVQGDVIELRLIDVRTDPEKKPGEYLVPVKIRWGNVRWLKERAKHIGQEIRKKHELHRQLKEGQKT